MPDQPTYSVYITFHRGTKHCHSSRGTWSYTRGEVEYLRETYPDARSIIVVQDSCTDA
jgi:hypothetical protein